MGSSALEWATRNTKNGCSPDIFYVSHRWSCFSWLDGYWWWDFGVPNHPTAIANHLSGVIPYHPKNCEKSNGLSVMVTGFLDHKHCFLMDFVAKGSTIHANLYLHYKIMASLTKLATWNAFSLYPAAAWWCPSSQLLQSETCWMNLDGRLLIIYPTVLTWGSWMGNVSEWWWLARPEWATGLRDWQPFSTTWGFVKLEDRCDKLLNVDCGYMEK